jgi:hypothetical protein
MVINTLQKLGQENTTDKPIHLLKFTNSVRYAGLPIDNNNDNQPKLVEGAFFARTMPQPIENVKIAATSSSCFKWMGVKNPTSSQEKDEAA